MNNKDKKTIGRILEDLELYNSLVILGEVDDIDSRVLIRATIKGLKGSIKPTKTATIKEMQKGIEDEHKSPLIKLLENVNKTI